MVGYLTNLKLLPSNIDVGDYVAICIRLPPFIEVEHEGFLATISIRPNLDNPAKPFLW